MKERKGFVSNSSSSSFLCNVCGKHDVGYDGTADVGMAQCEAGHVFCTEHAVNVDEHASFNDDKYHWGYGNLEFNNFDECYTEDYDDADEVYDCVPVKYCPICNLDVLTDSDFIEYMNSKGITRESVLKEIKAKFNTYDEFKEAMRKC